jgi:transcriptional regulator GlxA family with amidase domain
VELLDFAGPGEVFEVAGSAVRTAGGERSFNVFTVSPKPGPIVSQGFVTVQPQYTIENCPEPDIIVIPGGGTTGLRQDEGFMAWVADAASKTDLSMSVCTGAFVLADIGALDGVKATTHWSAISGLAGAAQRTKVLSDVRFVDSGKVVTTAGVSAGIDGALHVVARLLGRAAAEDAARHMEYEWRPRPEDLASYPMYAPEMDEVGVAKQKADRLFRQQEYAEAIDALRTYLQARPDDADAWYRLGYSLISEKQLEESLEANRSAERLSDGMRRAICIYNQACALSLLGRTDEALDALERSIEAGYRNKAWMMQDSDIANLRGTERFKELMERIE